jgi:carbonic anhydrase
MGGSVIGLLSPSLLTVARTTRVATLPAAESARACSKLDCWLSLRESTPFRERKATVDRTRSQAGDGDRTHFNTRTRSMQKLVRGVHEFQSSIFSEQKELFERLAGGQTPEALFITCSDSRINPNLLTQTQPGELFILRNAGNIVPPWGEANGGEAATVEYAVRVLDVRDIIICGHTHCGAMAGLLSPEAIRESPAVRQWLKHADATLKIIRDKYSDEAGEELLTDTIKENVLCQIENLRTHPCVAAGIARETLKLHGWIYQFETGDVFAYDPRERKFQPLASLPAEQLGVLDAPAI